MTERFFTVYLALTRFLTKHIHFYTIKHVCILLRKLRHNLCTLRHIFLGKPPAMHRAPTNLGNASSKSLFVLLIISSISYHRTSHTSQSFASVLFSSKNKRFLPYVTSQLPNSVAQKGEVGQR